MLIVFAREKVVDCRLKAIYADLIIPLFIWYLVDTQGHSPQSGTVWAVAVEHSVMNVALESLDYDIMTPGPLPTLR